MSDGNTSNQEARGREECYIAHVESRICSVMWQKMVVKQRTCWSEECAQGIINFERFANNILLRCGGFALIAKNKRKNHGMRKSKSILRMLRGIRVVRKEILNIPLLLAASCTSNSTISNSAAWAREDLLSSDLSCSGDNWSANVVVSYKYSS